MGATRRIRVASMVLSSPKILQALLDQINANRDVAGIYDGPEMADDTVATGSFNLSTNATKNAENVLRIASADLAGQYAAYVDDLVQRYAPAPA
jgi:hypothetical protein